MWLLELFVLAPVSSTLFMAANWLLMIAVASITLVYFHGERTPQSDPAYHQEIFGLQYSSR